MLSILAKEINMMENNIKTILIYDQQYTGHHLNYVSMITETYYENGWKVFFASDKGILESDEYKHFLEPIKDKFELIKLTKSFSEKNAYFRLVGSSLQLIKTIKQYETDVVFLPYLDRVFYCFGLAAKCFPYIRNRKMVGILFRGGFSYIENKKKIISRFKSLISRKIINMGVFANILLLDEFHCEHLINDSNGKTQLKHCPDPVNNTHTISQNEFRDMFGIPREARVLGVFGLITERKGVDLLLNAYSKRPRDDKEYLLLMGKHSQNMIDIVRSLNSKQVISVDEFVSNDILISGINAVDVVAAVYNRHVGSASIVARAAVAGKPVLGADYGYVGYVVRKYKLGLTCDPNSELDLDSALEHAFNGLDLDLISADEFATKNSKDCFCNAILIS